MLFTLVLALRSPSTAETVVIHQLDVHEMFEVALSTFPLSARNPFKAVGCTWDCIRRNTPHVEDIQRVSHQRRLLIGVSKHQSWCKLQPVNIHQFRDNEYAVAVTSASCCLPVLGGLRGVLIDGERYFDGQLTQNWSRLPVFDDVQESDCIVRVTAYHNPDFEALRSGWITPRIQLPQVWTLMPHSIEALRLLWRLGYLRTIEYLLYSQDALRLRKHFHEPSPETCQSLATDLQRVMCALEPMMQERLRCGRPRSRQQ